MLCATKSTFSHLQISLTSSIFCLRSLAVSTLERRQSYGKVNSVVPCT